MTRHLPDVPPCPCRYCRALAAAIDADVAARLAVAEAAERVDARHGLGKPDPHSSPGPGRGTSPSAPAISGTTPGSPAVGGPPRDPSKE